MTWIQYLFGHKIKEIPEARARCRICGTTPTEFKWSMIPAGGEGDFLGEGMTLLFRRPWPCSPARAAVLWKAGL